MNASIFRPRALRTERDWASAPHALFGLCLLALLFVNVWGELPLIVSLASTVWFERSSRDVRPFAVRHARESLNLQITFQIAYIATFVVSWLLTGPQNPKPFLVAVIVLYLAAVVLTWIAFARAVRGEDARLRVLRILR